MRILAIRGRNLASLADTFDVDFTAEPLAGSGIFAITGPTGAGKSTLLDAVCLALFNDIPRLKAAPSSGRIGGDSDETGISLKDTRAILRHGASDCFAEVDFAMPGGPRYRARWSVKRARHQATGKLQQYEHSFARLDTQERLGGTRTETLAAIRSVLGLTAEQFGRAVLLAQGDFEAFIRADANDRAVLLERLTGSEIYATLGQRAAEKAKALNDKLDVWRARIAAQNGLDDGRRNQAEAELAAAIAAEAEAGSTLDALKQARLWEERATHLAAQVAHAREGLTSAQQQDAQAAPRREALAQTRRAQALVPKWAARKQAAEHCDRCVAACGRAAETVVEARSAEDQARTAEALALGARSSAEAEAQALAPLLAEARALDLQIESTLRILHERREEAAKGDTRLGEATQANEAKAAALQDAQQSYSVEQEWLAAHQALGDLARRQSELDTQLAEYRGASKALDATLREQPKLQNGHAAALERCNAAQALLDNKVRAYESAAEARVGAEKALPANDALPKLTDRLSALSRIDTLLMTAKGAQQAIVHANADLARTRGALVDTKEIQAKLTARQDALALSLPALEKEVANGDRELALLYNAASDTAEALRSTLFDGGPCPVCGSAHHQLALFEGKLGDHLRERDTALKTLAAERDKQQLEALDIDAQLSAQATHAVQLARDEREQVKRLGEATRQVAEVQVALSAAAAHVALPQDVKLLSDALEAERKAIGAQIKANTAAHAAADRARHNEQLARAEREEARDTLEAARKVVEAKARALADLDATMDKHRAEVGRLAVALDRWLSPAGEWHTQTDAAAWLAERAASWRTHEEEAARLVGILPEMQKEAATAAEALRNSTARAKELTQALRQATEEHTILVQRRTGLLENEPVVRVEQRLAAARQEAETTFQRENHARQAAANTLAGAIAAEKAATEALDRAQLDHERHADVLAQALGAAGIAEQAVAHVAAMADDALDEEAQTLESLRSALAAARSLLNAREADLDAHHAGEPPALLGPDLEVALASATASCEAVAQLRREAELVIRQDDTVRVQTAGLRAELDKEMADADVWLRLNAVIGDRTGAAFRRFAQGLTLDRLLEQANMRLAELKPRYTLERGTGGDMLIQVVDNDMGGETRGLHNLSGGERFLVSLALALGLAELSTASGVKIESLFIDEGFGALDPASLGQAVALLEQLHATGRRVGVISHVEELKERIPVQIAVSPSGRGTSSVAVIGS